MSALALQVLLASALLAQTPCAGRYQDSYLGDWGLSSASWQDACARGLKPDDILRSAQQASIQACAARYGRLEDAGKAPRGTVSVYCAQGEAGRSRLGALAGETTGAPAEAKPAPGARKPGERNMGPAAASLKTARARWQPDACWSGFYYTQEPTDLTDETDFVGLKPGEHVRPRRSLVEQYTHFFTSPQTTVGYRVTTGDSLMTLACYPTETAPEAMTTIAAPGFRDCLDEVPIDFRRALELAGRAGLAAELDGSLHAYLGTFPTGYFTSPDCRLVLGTHGDLDCGASSWDQGKLRRAAGKLVWVVAGGGKTVILDAKRKDRVYFVGPGELRPNHVPDSYVIGVPCKYVPGM